MQAHIVSAYDADLKELDGLVREMTSRTRVLLEESTRALAEGDVERAQRVIAADAAVDLLQHRIEEKAITTIAKRQPVAVDLRHIVSTIRVANDLERIGDLAKNVTKRVIAIAGQPASVKVASSLSALAERVINQLEAVSVAYQNRDDAAALEVWKADGAIDVLHTSLFRELLTYMMEDPRSIGFCTHLLFCAKNLERVGDHATNIAETIHYMLTGDMLAGERPKADGSSGVDPNLEAPRA